MPTTVNVSYVATPEEKAAWKLAHATSGLGGLLPRWQRAAIEAHLARSPGERAEKVAFVGEAPRVRRKPHCIAVPLQMREDIESAVIRPATISSFILDACRIAAHAADDK